MVEIRAMSVWAGLKRVRSQRQVVWFECLGGGAVGRWGASPISFAFVSSSLVFVEAGRLSRLSWPLFSSPLGTHFWQFHQGLRGEFEGEGGWFACCFVWVLAVGGWLGWLCTDHRRWHSRVLLACDHVSQSYGGFLQLRQFITAYMVNYWYVVFPFLFFKKNYSGVVLYYTHFSENYFPFWGVWFAALRWTWWFWGEVAPGFRIFTENKDIDPNPEVVEDNRLDESQPLTIYTDGSCINTG
jgi:hypothetical protein